MAYRERGGGLLEEAFEMLRDADRMHRRFFTLAVDRGGACWEPPLDMVENERGLTISVALPGVNPDAVEVRTDGTSLTVIGARPLPAGPGAVIHRLEIPYGRFERRINLPGGTFEVLSKQLADGCLVLQLHRLS
jgi:HSP20 family molecular chaperone IbpA